VTPKNREGHLIARYSEIPLYLIQPFIEGYIFECTDTRPYNFFDDMEESYPLFRRWFYEKIIPELGKKTATREVFFILEKSKKTDVENLSGFAILKKTGHEKKICSFRIAPRARMRGYAYELFQACFDYLDTSNPILTIPSKIKDDFHGILDRYKFQLMEERPNYYVEGEVEYVFNGYLTDDSVNRI
jgi:hypothetical protein